MLRVNFSYLEYRDQKYYYEGKLFTGASFKLAGYIIEEFWRFEEGIKIGNYQSEYLPNNPSLLRVSVDALEFNGEYLASYASYQNQAFSGIGYDIDIGLPGEECCTGEHLFSDGWPSSYVEWDFSGQMECLGLVSADFKQFYGWSSDGSLSSFELHSNDLHGRIIHLSMNKQNKFRSIWIEEEYFDWLAKFRNQLEFDCFTTKSAFIDFPMGSNLGLYSPGVDDEIFHYLRANNKLENLDEITISRTSISDRNILELANLSNLKTISFDDRKRDLRGVAQQLKDQRPDCSVILNSEGVKN